MAEYPNTPFLGLKRPIANTGQPWSTQKYIVDNMDLIEANALSVDGRLDAVEPKVATLETEQKWGPVMVKPTAVTASVGTIAIDTNGRIVFTGVGTLFRLDGLFTSDFDRYELLWDFTSSTSDGDIGIQMAVGGVGETGANYKTNRIENNSSGTLTSPTAVTQTQIVGPRFATNGGVAKTTVHRPAHAQRTVLFTESIDEANYMRIIGGSHNQSVAYDGLRCVPSSAFTGYLRVLGYRGN